MAAAAILDNFEWPCLCDGSGSTYSAHRAVIFAIAQLSCLLVVGELDSTRLIWREMLTWKQIYHHYTVRRQVYVRVCILVTDIVE